MLNRRHLRIKVLHSLYSFFQSEETELYKSEKELLFGIDKVHELYIYLLLLLVNLKAQAEEKIELRKNKRLPSPEDLNPNTKFVDNRVLNWLSNSHLFNQIIEKTKISWVNYPDLQKSIFKSIQASSAYQNYMNDAEDGLDSDKKALISMFRNEVANSDFLLQVLEEKSIYWQDDIDLVCLMVIKTIEQFEGNLEQPIMSLFKEDEEEIKFVKTLFRKTIAQNQENLEFIEERTQNWEKDRIALMDTLLMRMAITEAREFASIPTKVTLNEYIEISKFYSTPKSNGFINGVLDSIFTELKAQGVIKKRGRGLIE